MYNPGVLTCDTVRDVSYRQIRSSWSARCNPEQRDFKKGGEDTTIIVGRSEWGVRTHAYVEYGRSPGM